MPCATIRTAVLISSLCLGYTPVTAYAGDISTVSVRNLWAKSDGKLVYFDGSAKAIKEIKLEKKDEVLGVHPKIKFTEKSFLSVTGGVSRNGKYAWSDRRDKKWLSSGGKGDYLFQYYGADGKLLWEKKNAVAASVSEDGELIFLLEVDPKWIATLEYGNSYTYPAIYRSSGNLVVKVPDCGTYQESWEISRNNKYATIGCQSLKKPKENYQVIFNLTNITKKPWKGPGGVDINSISDNGTFNITESRQEKNPQTGKYEFRTVVKSEGKLE